MKYLAILTMLFLSLSAYSQNGYVKQTIVGGDTTTNYVKEQIYWKIRNGVGDDIFESKLNPSTGKFNVSYPIISREYDGYIKEFVVSGKNLNIADFTIRFHSRDNTVTYIYENKIIIYRGKNVKFHL